MSDLKTLTAGEQDEIRRYIDSTLGGPEVPREKLPTWLVDLIERAEAAEAEAYKWREDAINLAEELRLEQNPGYSCWQLVRHDSLMRGGK